MATLNRRRRTSAAIVLRCNELACHQDPHGLGGSGSGSHIGILLICMRPTPACLSKCHSLYRRVSKARPRPNTSGLQPHSTSSAPPVGPAGASDGWEMHLFRCERNLPAFKVWCAKIFKEARLTTCFVFREMAPAVFLKKWLRKTAAS